MIKKEQKQIRITWEMEDIQSLRPDLDHDQILNIMQFIVSNYDPDIGINWGMIKDAANELYPLIKELDETSQYFHQFECMDCEGHILVSAQSMDNIYNDSEWPNQCPYCGSDRIFLDSKLHVQLKKMVDVRTLGEQHKTEDIGYIDYTCKSPMYVDLPEKKESK